MNAAPDRLKQLEEENASLKDELEAAEQELGSLGERLDRAEGDAEDANARAVAAEEALDQLRRHVKEFTDHIPGARNSPWITWEET